MPQTVFILLGSNVGDRERNLDKALHLMGEIDGLEITAQSAIYLSQAQDMVGENPSFMNQVVMGDYAYLPSELLAALESIEKRLGRTAKGLRQPRTIDLDILLFGDQIVETERLSIPHRELLNRPFAMVPMLEIDPEVVHPVTRRPVAEFLDEDAADEIILFREHIGRSV